MTKLRDLIMSARARRAGPGERPEPIQQIAQRAQISTSYLSRIMSGHVSAPTWTLERIAMAMEIPTARVLAAAKKN